MCSPFWGNALQSGHIAARATQQTVPASLSTVFFFGNSTRATIHGCELISVCARVVCARADARPEWCGGRGGCACMRGRVDPLLHVCLHECMRDEDGRTCGFTDAQGDGPLFSLSAHSPLLLPLPLFFLSLWSPSRLSPEYLTVGRGAAGAEALNDTFELKVLRRLRGELAVASHGTRLVAVVQLLRTRCSP
jgi:hypothetical protein